VLMVVTAIDRLGRSVAEIRVTNVAQPISVQ
jgi:hypothetical protein